MSDSRPSSDRSRLRAIAVRAMRDRGLDPDFSADAIAQAEEAPETPPPGPIAPRDLRALPWCSIDNDDSRDLDQLSVAEEAANGHVTVRVAIADVDAQVPKDSPDRPARGREHDLGLHAGAGLSDAADAGLHRPDLAQPRRRSAGDRRGDDRRAGRRTASTAVYRAMVRNHAKLAYRGVGAWLAGHGPLPTAAAAVPGLDALLTLQDHAARWLSERRHE